MARATLPGPRLPAPVQTGHLWHDPERFLSRCEHAFGDAFQLRLWPIGTVVVISSPELVRALVFTPRAELLTGEATRRLLPILGEHSVAALDGEEHARRRRLLLPIFGGHRLEAHADRIRFAVADELASWPRGEPLSGLPRLRRLTLAVAADLVLGERPPQLEPLLREYVAGRAALASWFPKLLPARLILERRRRELDRLLLKSVRRPPAGEHALGALVEGGLEPAAVVEELRALLLVAHESTACALAWTLERLARHPQVIERLREEDPVYVDAVAREVLRTRPPVLDTVRLATRTIALPDGRTIATGSIVMASPLLVQRRADLYPCPHEFRPERFLDGRPPEGADVAFGGGERRCLGAQLAAVEIKWLVRTVAGGYSLTPATSAPERMRLVGTAVAPAQGARITLLARGELKV